jgi:hypothetical protein
MGQDCEITIRGSRQSIYMAKGMIRKIIEVGMKHPFAGWAEGGFDAGGGGSCYQQQGYGRQAPQVVPQQEGGYRQEPQYPPRHGQPVVTPPARTTSEWKYATSPDGKVHYYNERTGATQWEMSARMP